ncbi:hypothetical protein R6Q59_033209 [Mikania micrantha]|uniref:Uncharacterized protein n=1 Tax=Mikania micrantha TaxID=192012 RepID=A0A5N6MLD2_9ASTR|nr:hypothetical protein E3N88_30141 [Mikania micrantha]
MGPGDQPTPPSHLVDAPTRRPEPPVSSLYKHKSWSPDIVRDEEWLRRKDNHYLRHSRQNKSVTDEDIDELKACIELGFGFGESDDRLSDTLPALGLYYAVNKHYHDTISKSPSSSSLTLSDSGLSSSPDNTNAIFGSGDNPQMMKTRLRQWAQVVACSLRQSSPSPLSSL